MVPSWMPNAKRTRLLAALLLLAAALVPAAMPAEAACLYRAGFVADVSIPDNTNVAAGSTFTKTWRVRNDGSCSWGPGTPVDALVFSGGTRMAASDSVPIGAVIAPGQTADLSITMTSPAAAGTYRSNWKFQRVGGTPFGVGAAGISALYAQIVVTGAPPPPPVDAIRINFAPGATVTTLQEAVTFPARDSYLLRARGGQRMTIAIVSANERANFSLQGVTDGLPLKRLENESRYWTGVLPTNQDYLLRVAVASGSTTYALSIAIAP